MTGICYRCGMGSIQGINSALVRRALQREGFRPQLVYIHKNDAVCSTVLDSRARMARAEAAEQKRQNVWWRRLPRVALRHVKALGL